MAINLYQLLQKLKSIAMELRWMWKKETATEMFAKLFFQSHFNHIDAAINKLIKKVKQDWRGFPSRQIALWQLLDCIIW